MADELSSERFRNVVGRFATGVTVVTTAVDGALHGMTVNSFTSVSLDPLMVLVCIDRGAGMHELLRRSGRFAVTILDSSQEGDSVWFSFPRRPTGGEQFEGLAWRPATVSGCPVLEDGLAFLDCIVSDVHAAGDHSLFLAHVVDMGELGEGEPLVYYHSDYRRLR